MSIFIKLEPKDLQPVYNEIILVLDSNRKDQPLFNYVVDINIDGVFSSQVKVDTNLDGYGILDMHKHLESAVSFDIDIDNTEINKQNTNTFIKYDVELSEQYLLSLGYGGTSDNGGYNQMAFGEPHFLSVGDKITIADNVSLGGQPQIVRSIVDGNTITIELPYTGNEGAGTATRTDGNPTTIPDSAIMTGDKFAFNGVLPWLDVPNWDQTIYNVGLGTDRLLLTTSPTHDEGSTTVKMDDRLWFNWVHTFDTETRNIIVTTNRGIFFIKNDYDDVIDENRILSMGVGPWNLMNTTSTVTSHPSLPPQLGLPMFDDDTTSYTISTGDDLLPFIWPVPTSDTYVFTIDRSCSKFENYKLVYLDRFGSLLNVNFELSHTKKTKVKKTDYRKNYGGYNPTTNSWGYDSYSRGKTRLDTDITDTYKITTNWVNEQVGQQVIDLMESPEVYHLREDGTLLAINITTSSLEQKQKVNEKLFNYKLGFEYSFKNTVQRG